VDNDGESMKQHCVVLIERRRVTAARGTNVGCTTSDLLCLKATVAETTRDSAETGSTTITAEHDRGVSTKANTH
jgi:hypothetical protein